MNIEIFDELLRNAFFQLKYYFDVISQMREALELCKSHVIAKESKIVNMKHFFTKQMLEFNHGLSNLQSSCLEEIRTNMTLVIEENEIDSSCLNTERFDLEIKQMLSLDFSKGNQIVNSRLREKIQQFTEIIDVSGTFAAGGGMNVAPGHYQRKIST